MATYAAPIHVVGDFNVRLDRHDDSNATQFRSLMASYGLPVPETGPTHARGGTLDAVASLAYRDVSVIDSGLSDHHAVYWRSSSVTVQPPPVDIPPPAVRPWRRLDLDEFHIAVAGSRLCQPDSWPDDVDELCSIYDSELLSIVNRLLPLRRRPSDPWFDMECRASKRSTRLLERRYRSSSRGTRMNWSRSRVADVAAAKAAWYAQRRSYRQLRQRKCADFRRRRVDAASSNPRRLWDAIDQLLGRGRTPSDSSISVEQFSDFFYNKIDAIRRSTVNSPPATYIDLPGDVRFSSFAAVADDDVISAIRRLPNKSSAADPIPTSLLQSIADLVDPYVARLFNRSMSSGRFPAAFKNAFITPIVKKAGMDAGEVGSYRPISNLPVLFKLFERVVARQLLDYLQNNNLLPPLQSGFRPAWAVDRVGHAACVVGSA